MKRRSEEREGEGQGGEERGDVRRRGMESKGAGRSREERRLCSH